MKKKKRKKRKFDIDKQFDEALNYIGECKWHIFAIVLIFAYAFFIGFFYAEQFTFLDKFIAELFAGIEGLNWFGLIAYIFQNNVFSAFLGLFLGFFLGIFPVLNALTNGVLIGYVSNTAVAEAGVGSLWRLLPHGIFELPAIFISLAMGLRLGGFILAKQRKKELKRRFYNSANAFLLIVIPLLVIAAIIEGILIILL